MSDSLSAAFLLMVMPCGCVVLCFSAATISACCIASSPALFANEISLLFAPLLPPADVQSMPRVDVWPYLQGQPITPATVQLLLQYYIGWNAPEATPARCARHTAQFTRIPILGAKLALECKFTAARSCFLLCGAAS